MASAQSQSRAPLETPATQLEPNQASSHTVKPLERVVAWVFAGRETGEANRLTGWMDFKA